MQGDIESLLTELSRLGVRYLVVGGVFAEAYARATWAPLGSENVPVVAIDDLIAMKRRAGLPRDQEDIDALLALRKKHELYARRRAAGSRVRRNLRRDPAPAVPDRSGVGLRGATAMARGEDVRVAGASGQSERGNGSSSPNLAAAIVIAWVRGRRLPRRAPSFRNRPEEQLTT
jgi:hypothetical protein